MAVNTLGYVVLADGGTPRTFTGQARETISGGQFVTISGASGVVGSGASSFGNDDIRLVTGGSGINCVGIATQTVTSGNSVSVATRGNFLVRCYTDTAAGLPVDCEGSDACGPGALAEGGGKIGKALTAGGSGGYMLISLNI